MHWPGAQGKGLTRLEEEAEVQLRSQQGQRWERGFVTSQAADQQTTLLQGHRRGGGSREAKHFLTTSMTEFFLPVVSIRCIFYLVAHPALQPRVPFLVDSGIEHHEVTLPPCQWLFARKPWINLRFLFPLCELNAVIPTTPKLE